MRELAVSLHCLGARRALHHWCASGGRHRNGRPLWSELSRGWRLRPVSDPPSKRSVSISADALFCPGLPYGLGWAAGSFPSLPCSLPSPLPSSESPCIPCPRWNKQGSRLWGRAIGALPCLHHAMTPLLFPLLLASLLPSSSCNKGECGGRGVGAQKEGVSGPAMWGSRRAGAL